MISSCMIPTTRLYSKEASLRGCSHLVILNKNSQYGFFTELKDNSHKL